MFMLKNYSKNVNKALKGVKIGDRIQIRKGKNTYEGILMPRIEIGDNDCIVLKLKSGYNIGIKLEKGVKVEKINKKYAQVEHTALISEGGHIKKISASGEEHESGHIKKISSLDEVGEVGYIKKFRKDKPPISIVVTGGTITSKVDYKTGGVTSLVKPEELLVNAPELYDIVNVRKIESPFIKMSESFNYKDWQKMAQNIVKLLNGDDQGVILTQGTDTLHYTGAALSFMIRNLSKPVVLVGSQRSIDRPSSDSNMNLICGSHIAVSEIAEVGTCMHGSMNDDYCLFIRGTKVRKMHTSRRDAFRPINERALAKVWMDGKIKIKNEIYKKRTDEKVKTDLKFEPKVALVKYFPGASPEIIDFYLKKGYKGLVVEATGLGQVSSLSGGAGKEAWTPVLRKAVEKGMSVCFAAQTIYGRLKPFVYSEAREAFESGVIFLKDMLPETALIKLGWVLGHTRKWEKVSEMMLTNYAGEISERTEIKSYLE